MNPIPAAFLTAAITTLGRWSKGKGLTVDTVVGLVFLAIFLAVMEQANSKVARAFGLLIVVSVAVVHLPAILPKVKQTPGSGAAIGAAIGGTRR